MHRQVQIIQKLYIILSLTNNQNILSMQTNTRLQTDPKLKLKIFISQYLIANKPYDFHSKQRSEFKFKKYQSQIYQIIYIYEDQLKQIILSNSMDPTNKMELIFALQTRQNHQQYVLKFLNTREIIQKFQSNFYSQTKIAQKFQINYQLKQNTQAIEKRGKKMRDLKHLLVNSKSVPTYFFPYYKNSKPFYFVPRFMNKYLICQETQILITSVPQYKFQNKLPQFNVNSLIIKKINLDFSIKQVQLSQITNNQQLHIQNQMNLIHFCEYTSKQILQNQICVICQQDAWQQEYQIQDVPVSLCHCSGSVKYKHLKCLATWLNQQINKSNLKDILKCLQCHRPYPQFIQVSYQFNKGKKKNTGTESGLIQTRFYHFLTNSHLPTLRINQQIIKIKSNQISIGSTLDSSFIINNKEKKILARIQLDTSSKKLYIKDEKSKYGVLIRQKNMEYRINKGQLSNQKIALLVDNKVIHFSFEKKV